MGVAFAGEDLASQFFALDDRLENPRQHEGLGIEVRQHLQLHERFVPLAQHALDLKQKDAQTRILGFRPHRVLQVRQGFFQAPGPHEFFGFHE